MLKLKTLITLATLTTGTIAAEVGIYWENDGTFAKPNSSTDRHYTNGARIDVAINNPFSSLRELGTSLPWMSETNEPNSAFGLFFGQVIQTPDFIANPELRTSPEMRYAGWLYGGPFVQYADNMNMDHIEMSLGVIGPSAIGHETQDFIHNLRAIPQAADWDTQMSDRFAGNLNWLHKFRVGSEKYYTNGPVYLELLGETALAAGTVHRNASTGITLRAGNNLSGDFGPGSMSRPRYYLQRKKQRVNRRLCSGRRNCCRTQRTTRWT